MFQAHYEDFFITSADSEQIRVLKLDILCLLATETSIKYILQEFQVVALFIYTKYNGF